MSYEDEFDRIIRNKADEMEFPFDEGNWEKASRMLDADRIKTPVANTARSYWTSVVVSVAGVAVVVSVLGSYLDINNSQPRSIAANTSVEKASAQPSVEASISELTASEKRADEITTPETTIGQSEVKNQETSPAEATASEQSPAKETFVAKGQAPSNADKTPLREENNNVGNHSSPAALAGAAVAGSGMSAANNNAAAPASPIVEKKEEPVTANKESATPVTEESAQPVLEPVSAENLQSINGELVHESVPSEATPSFNYIALYDDYYKKRGMVTQFGIEGGAAYLTGWSTPLGTDGKGWNWFAGATFNTQFSSRFGVGTGLQVYNVANVSQPFYAQQGKDYHFGSTQTGTTITTNDLLYVAIPLQVTYRISSINFAGLGINAGYLSGASNNVKTYSVLDNVVTPVSDETDKGVYDGVRPFNLMLNASFTTKICPRFALKAEFNYGLTDLFTNNAAIRNAERSTGVRVGIRYTLLEK